MNGIVDPVDGRIFHVILASGQSEYRRGIPANRRKCCGKNVTFTPKNIAAKCVLSRFGFIVSPVISIYRWMNPVMFANTAPVHNTSCVVRLTSTEECALLLPLILLWQIAIQILLVISRLLCRTVQIPTVLLVI
jgi:hypothetical protein